MTACRPARIVLQHIKRANYQYAVWKCALEVRPSYPSPIGHGWCQTGYSLEPQWMTQPSGPCDMVELTTCQCVKSRCTKQCKCVRQQLRCTQSCACEGDMCDNNYNDNEDDGSEDDPDLESDFTDDDEWLIPWLANKLKNTLRLKYYSYLFTCRPVCIITWSKVQITHTCIYRSMSTMYIEASYECKWEIRPQNFKYHTMKSVDWI